MPVIARRVAIAVAATAFGLVASGSALAATHRGAQKVTVHHAVKVVKTAKQMAAMSSSSCPNMGGSSSSPSAA
jgi:hypothetical protein